MDIAGAATVVPSNFSFIASISGGAITGGAVVASSVQNYTAVGGVTIAGNATAILSYIIVGSGGLNIGGSVSISKDFFETAAFGSIVLGGNAVVGIGANLSGSGGILLNTGAGDENTETGYIYITPTETEIIFRV